MKISKDYNKKENNFERKSSSCRILVPAKKWFSQKTANQIMKEPLKKFIYLGKKDKKILLGFYTLKENLESDDTIKEPLSDQKTLIRHELLDNNGLSNKTKDESCGFPKHIKKNLQEKFRKIKNIQ